MYLAFPHDVLDGLAFEQAGGQKLPEVGGDLVCIPLVAADTCGGVGWWRGGGIAGGGGT